MATCTSNNNNSAVSSKVRTAWQNQASKDESDWKKNGDATGQNTILEFFQVCDSENKGFITRRDMQRLNSELHLTAEELENVFDTLDSDGNGYLTVEEFSSGFSEFLFGQKMSVEGKMEEKTQNNGSAEIVYQGQWDGSTEDDEEKHFCMLMESLGANNVFENPTEIRELWAQLRRDEPHLLSNFEDFLARVTSQIIEANQEKNDMESALKRKAATHDDEIQRLYEEMEQQIKNEKDRIVLQDYKQFLSRSQDLELQLSSKEKDLEHLFHKQKRLENQCHELHSEQHVTKVENVKLKQTNDELMRELEHTSQELILAQEQLALLQEQSSRLHEEKEIEIYRLTEGLQRERASLLKQLDLMKEMNKHLRDERDICYQRPKKSSSSVHTPLSTTSSDIFRSDGADISSDATRPSVACAEVTRGHLQRIISIEEDHLPHLLQSDCQVQSPLQECSEAEEDGEDNMDLVMSDIIPTQQTKGNETPMSPRGQPVGKETSLNEENSQSPPDRLFKIVMVGNSSVGKTSLLKRFCDDCFHPGTSATVGIDYSVKTITVDNSQIALQMWDTAGQERYRSITKQFFRKADGVIVMYDITAEHSFTAVRQWLTSIKEAAGDDISIMLLANKTDKEAERQVQKEMGERLAKDCQMSFFECSACSGHNVLDSMVELARTLKDQEDREKEKTVSLVSNPSEKKRSCC